MRGQPGLCRIQPETVNATRCLLSRLATLMSALNGDVRDQTGRMGDCDNDHVHVVATRLKWHV